MVFNPATDFLALWRNIAGQVSKVEMPGLDYVLAALARAGVINLTVAAAAPVANQATTAWFKTAVPSNSAEGQFFLWDKVATVYVPATPALFLQLLEASAGENGSSWFSGNGAPANTIGNNGDFYARLDAPNGIYGPKAGGAWPLTPIPGTSDVVTSTALDNTFGSVQGSVLYRGPALWQVLPIGADNAVLISLANVPAWDGLSVLLDVVFGGVQGDILYRGAGAWNVLAPGVAQQVLQTGGPGSNPSWVPRTAEFASGTTIVFYQPTAPVGWVKQTLRNDCGLRVTSGAGGAFTAGSAFSAVFAQTAVGDTTLSVAQMPNHQHFATAAHSSAGQWNPGGGGSPAVITNDSAAGTTFVGGGAPHNHSINLTLAYADVIIASKS